MVRGCTFSTDMPMNDDISLVRTCKETAYSNEDGQSLRQRVEIEVFVIDHGGHE